MKIISDEAKDNNSKVTGITMESLHNLELTNPRIDDLVVTHSLLERKDEFMKRSDAFLVLPGGVGSLDKVWAERDYDALKSFIADGASLQFYNGTTASNGDEFVAIIEKQYQDGLAEGNSGEWVFRYAFSIKPSKPEGTDHPNNRGEWVNAGFAGSDGSNYNEWYQVENGKIISWSQTRGVTSAE